MFRLKVFRITILLMVQIILVASFANASSIDSLRKALVKDDKNPSILLALGEQYKFSNVDSALFFGNKYYGLIDKSNLELVAKYYNLIGNVSLAKNELEESINNFKLAIATTKSKVLNFDNGIYHAGLAQAYMFKGENTKAIENYNTSIAYYEKDKDNKNYANKISIAYSSLGDAYGLVGLNDNALQYLYKALALQRKSNDDLNVGLTLNSIGVIQDNMGLYARSNKSNFEALASLKKTNYTLAEGTILLNIGMMYYKQKIFDSAFIYGKYAEKIMIASDTKFNLANVKNLFAEIEMENNNFAKAEQLYNEGIAQCGNNTSQPIYGQLLIGYADLLTKQKKYNDAYLQYQKAIQLFEKENSLLNKKLCYQKMTSYFLENKNSDSAQKYYQLFQNTSDSFLTSEKQNSIIAQEIKFETSVKQVIIEKQNSEIKTKNQQNIILFGGIGMLSLLAFSLGLLYNKIKNKNNIINIQKREILHNNKNNINQLIAIFQQQSRIPGNEKNAIENQERLFTLNLLNKMLYDNDGATIANINEYLPKLCEAKQISSGNKVKIIASTSTMQLNVNMLKDIGLIVNELCTNSIKYAFENIANPLIEVMAKQMDSRILLQIKDNGIGFVDANKSNVEGGFGMNFVKDLVAQHQGKMTIKSDKGACIDIELQMR